MSDIQADKCSMSDLFGNPLTMKDWEEKPKTIIRRKLGPLNYRPCESPGKCCRTCMNCHVHEYGKRYYKCALVGCSASMATDIRVRHVCDRWEERYEAR